MTRVLLAPDKFKGTLTAAEVAGHVARGLQSVAREAGVSLTVEVVPVADGGDGTLAAAEAAGFELVPITATGPTGHPVTAAWARRGDEAVVELAAVSALALLAPDALAPLTATSRGTGELVRAALDAGCRRVVLGIGGSACTDGGAGLAASLGARVRGADGAEVADGGAALWGAATLDLEALHPALGGDEPAEVVVACDVDNPLTGPRGAATVYGPQKGASPQDVAVLDTALGHWADLVAATTGTDHRDDPGAGAAGGVGFAAVALLGARLEPGVDLVFGLTGFHDALARLGPGDLVVTGEGSLDDQTLHGKAPAGVAKAAHAKGIRVVAVAGRCLLDDAALRTAHLDGTYALTDLSSDERELFGRPGPLLEELGRRVARDHLTTTGENL